MDFVTVAEAEDIIGRNLKDYGVEEIPCHQALGRVLAENLYADRDLPPFNRATVDGIAIKSEAYHRGVRSFSIEQVQAAGEEPKDIDHKEGCIEIMTGAAVAGSLDTVIRYEDISIENSIAAIGEIPVFAGMNIHARGKDKRQSDLVAEAPTVISPELLGLAASIGRVRLKVKKLPRIVIISTGDEMVPPESTPTPYQLRRSNGLVIRSALEKYQIKADTLHLNDDKILIQNTLSTCLENYDILLMSGGVSMGKFDYVPTALESLGVEKLFHKVKQRPGKPFWLGSFRGKQLVFAFPGNPVSVFMCLNRYFLPWLEKSLGLSGPGYVRAMLDKDISFKPAIQYFIQVRLHISDKGLLMASPFDSNGSGDYSNLIYAQAFMELPSDREEFKKGELFRIWRYNY